MTISATPVSPIDVAIAFAGGSQAKLGEILGESQQTISNWVRHGIPKNKRIAVATKLERLTAGSICRKTICPDDWHLIWPELAAAAGGLSAKEAA
ncbi:hypothetical protein ASL20_09815 [Cupriavidus necator]|uniref:YdaS family helix-turn-helix protein n=1 Tax=Cupriavidus necator TaxID=106590 RepID=UPI0007350E7A|nr:YdaS family helix-turn-helix protein [Cupriavidus necator]KUE88908.1 hypothetical protein ASL20_09815 [Cupriavidus necator]